MYNVNENLGTAETTKETNRRCYRNGTKDSTGEIGRRASNQFLRNGQYITAHH